MIDKLFDELPQNKELQNAFEVIFQKGFSEIKIDTILKRKKNTDSSTHPTEIVTCLLNRGLEKSFFIKYEFENGSVINDHRKNLHYEAMTYQYVLSTISLSTIKYYGTFVFNNGVRIMVLEFINDLIKFSSSKERGVILKAVKWIGEFHIDSKRFIKSKQSHFIDQYDEKYFLNWSKKAIDVVRNSNSENKFNWLLDLLEKFETNVFELVINNPVIVHGEYYPPNVRYANGVILPLDWQTTALSTGEIDLAALTDNWAEEVQDKCLIAYRAVIGSEEPIKKTRLRLHLAKIYLGALWISSFPKIMKKDHWVLNQLKKIESKIEV